MLPEPLLYLSACFEQNRSEHYDLLLRTSQQGYLLPWLKFTPRRGPTAHCAYCTEVLGHPRVWQGPTMVGWHAQREQQPHGVSASAAQLTAGGRHCRASSARLCILESATAGRPDIILECAPDVVPVVGGDTAAAAYGSAAPTARLRHSRWWRVAPSTWRLGPPADGAASRDPLKELSQRDRVRAFCTIASECSRTGGLLVVKLLDTDPALTACWEMAGFTEAVEAWLSEAAEGEARWRWMLPRAPRPPGAPAGESSAGSAEQGTLF